MDKIAITDHGNCSHIYKFSKKLKDAGIKYYPGEEFYFTPDATLKDKDHRKAFHLLAIAKTEKGVKNLYKLSSLSFMEGFYYNPRIDFEMLKKYNEGIIFSTACISGLVPELILADKIKEAEEMLLKYKEILKENLYIEIMPHNLPDQIKVNSAMVELSKKHNIPLLATCDAHFCWKDEVDYRRFLILMNKAGWGREDEDVGTLSSMYIMSEDDVRKEFKKYHPSLSESDIEAAINNTQKVLEGEPPKLDTEEIKLPILKGGYATEEEHLLNLLAKGLKFRGVENNPVYIDRMKKEFAVIKEVGFINYFLVMEDLFNFCREKGIFVGPGRGCFLPGTKVRTESRSPIGIEKKDLLLNKKAATFSLENKKILNHFEYDVKNENCIRLFLSNGEKIECTSDHKIFKKDIGFIAAKDLKVGDILLGPKTSRQKVLIKCPDCGKERYTTIKKIKRRLIEKYSVAKKDEFLCIKCFNKKMFSDPILKKKIIMAGGNANKKIESRTKNSNTIKKLMKETNLREKISLGLIKHYQLHPEAKKAIGEKTKENYKKDPTLIDRCTKKNGYITGKFYSEKNISNIFYQSSWELKALNVWENSSNITKFERPNLLIPYTYNKEEHYYKPDFLLYYKNGKKVLVEIKADWKLNQEKTLNKIKAAKKYCKKNNLEFCLLTGKELKLMNDALHNEISIEKIEEFNYTGKVYDLQIEDVHNYTVSGVTVHNSAGGCLIAYLLRITNIDPIKFGLIFERFYNAGRKGAEAAPDIDSDFEDERRGEVIKYLEDKYGADKISQICSVSQIKIKSGIKDVCRVLNIPIEDANKLSSAIPWDEYDTLEEAEETNPDAKKIIEDNKEVFDKVKYFLGFPRQMSKHAAGIVISSETIGNICPMMNTKVEKENFLVSQFDKNDIGHTGLIKFDILGLSTMTFIKHVLNQIKVMYGEEVNLLKIDLDDKKVFKSIYQTALTDNVFQMESAGMKGYLKKIKPECLEDIIILNTLFRPAGLISGSLDKYVNNRFNPDNIQKFGIPEIDEILKKTHYILAYDESKMEIVMKFLDFTLYEANIFRKNIIKWKDHREHIESKFLQKAQEKGLSLEEAKRLFEEMTGYAFCKAHSTAYSVLGYWCAWLKYYYPLAFLKASFIVSAGTETDKYNIQTAMKMASLFGYEILPPDINKSKAGFYFDDKNKKIYWSFSLVKGIGSTVADKIEKGQPYQSFNHFLEYIKGKKITKRAIVPLIALGSFDSLPNYKEEIETWWTKNKYEDSLAVLFTENLRTKQSKHLGIILNNHIDRSKPELQNCLDYDTFEKLPEKSNAILCGYLIDVEIKKSKKGNKYVILYITDDSYNSYEVMVSEKIYAYLSSKVELGDFVIYKAKKLEGSKLSLDKDHLFKLEF